MRFLSIPAAALCTALALSACQGLSAVNANPPQPVAGFVTDTAAFDQFIASQPSAEEFARVYPDVLLVLPGQIATKELRFNNSRYFAQLDEDGRIIGGRFM
ncbi:hypothetical protein [Sinimarinibacterium sp. NLF-5-8]|uniref:hypothetical protein n=1 Tax=Sinimarinibacterium sp. NLF-5-8 TaxID=2698684 RepID=UPI00137BB349|nr:hypothetical protein [Sinimarinibacterium sp. NLF-5-8]QHS11198.1 hypothetical protein GT972_14300 [Sinimarinibacterium sp. NLF-5-8]